MASKIVKAESAQTAPVAAAPNLGAAQAMVREAAAMLEDVGTDRALVLAARLRACAAQVDKVRTEIEGGGA